MRSRNPWHNMIILTLLLVLIGSFATAITLACKGATLGMIALGYLVGGWVAFLVGLPIIFFSTCKLGRLRRLSLSANATAGVVEAE